MKQATVSVIIPTFNALKLLQANLPSVFKALRPGDEVVIVDDAGTDTSLSWLKDTYSLKEGKIEESEDYCLSYGKHGQVTILVVQNLHNLRFAASCNRAVELARGEVIWLLNNDVAPEKDVLKHTLPYFEDPQTFAVGCQEKSGAHSAGKAKLWFAKGLFQHSATPEMTTGESDWVNGGSSFFSHEKWRQLGGFDQAFYPAYWEDIDLCFRARQNGWNIWFEAKAIVHHNHQTTNETVFGQQKIDDMSWHNGLVFTLKNGSLSQKLAFFAWQPYWWWARLQHQKHYEN